MKAFNKTPRAVPVGKEYVRPFQTDYSGCWSGHCKSRESAIIAAAKRMVNDCVTRATITDMTTGYDIARLTLSADKKKATIQVIEPFKPINIPGTRPLLRRVK
jgi:hypothetical protein